MEGRVALATNYSQFIQRAVLWYQQQQLALTTWADPKSPSPCQITEPVDDKVQWQPVLQQPPADFSNVEQALELELHPDIKSFYQLQKCRIMQCQQSPFENPSQNKG